MDVGQPPDAWIDRPPARERERQVGAAARQPLDQMQSLLLDEAADEQHDTSVDREPQRRPSPALVEASRRQPEDIGIDAVEDEPRRSLERHVREVLGHRRADEHHLIGSRQHRPSDQCIRGAHDTPQQRVAIGHGGDVLGEHDGFAVPASGQHGDDVGRIETVVQQHGVGGPHASPDGGDAPGSRQGQRQSELALRDVPGADRQRCAAAGTGLWAAASCRSQTR